MVQPGSSAVEDSASASSSSSHAASASNNATAVNNNYHLASLTGGISGSGGSVSSPMRSLSTASGGLYISAPGKIILFGEHAVVYGRTAVAGSIDLRTYVSLFTSADGRIYLSLPDLNVEKTWMLKDLQKAVERLAAENPLEDGPPSLEVIVPIARKLSGACEDQCGVQHLAVLAFWYLLIGVVQRKRDLLAVKVTVKFKLPACVGLGSSGAYCVCMATALLQTAGLIPPPSIPSDDDGHYTWEEVHLEMIRKWSAAAESLIHGRASGLDAAVCTYGGVASYKLGRPIENLQNVPNLKVILVNSKVERNTSRMVQNVREKFNKFPKIIEAIFDSIDGISIEAAQILQRPNLLDENGSGVLENGGRSATLTPSFGGGGGGSVGEPSDHQHHNLQPVSAGGRSSSLSSYAAGGKRGSTTSAVSGTSGDFRTKLERNELTETFEKLNDLSRINNQLLISLGVGHAKVDQICTLLGRYGIHPKMTGAGGGGSVFAFLKPDTSQTVLNMIREELNKQDYEMYQPCLGGPGVLCHLHKPDLFINQANPASGGSTSRSNTPASSHHGSHQSTPAIRHKK